jgi:hypothetical protein
LPSTAFKKKLHKCRPDLQPRQVEAQITQQVRRAVDADPRSLERGVRQRLADKINDNTLGLWLLVPEHLRLGSWDLLCGWTGRDTAQLEPRLALQLIHEAALCSNGIRQRRALSLRGFEVLNGLPFLATDQAIHLLLGGHTMEEAQRLQVALGKIRLASGHYSGKLLLIDPHRPSSYTQRHVRRHRKDKASKPIKTAEIFFCLDGDTVQPICFTQASSARTVTEATPELLALSAEILQPDRKRTLVAADTEHFTASLLDHVDQQTPFEILIPIPNQASVQKRLRAIPADSFVPRWAGYATAVLPYAPHHSRGGPYFELVQRQGEHPDQWHFNSFISTTDRDPVEALTQEYPKRWHQEEFFNFNQALGWHRAGTLNLNIRYGQMTMALLAQAAIHQFRTRLGEPYARWDAKHLATAIFRGLDGDVRVADETIVVTYYNAPNREELRHHYEGLPARLAAENVDPRIPWLYGFQLDFRFH